AEAVRRDVAEALFEHRRGGRMVAGGGGDEQVGDPFARYRPDERVCVRGVAGPRVDDRDVAVADDVGAGSLERELARVVGDHATDPGRDAITAPVFDVDVVDVR